MRFKKYIALLGVLLTAIVLKADYNPTSPPEPGGVTVSVAVTPSGAGYVSPATATVQPGTKVSFRAYRYAGYNFVEWQDREGERLSTSASYSFVAGEKDMLIVAKFEYSPDNPSEPVTPEEKGKLNLSVMPSGAGSVSGGGTYNAGTSVSISASNNTGYRFVNWTRDGEVVGTSKSMLYQVQPGDNNLVANFKYNPSNPSEPTMPESKHRLYLQSSPWGACSFNITSGTKYNEGASINVTANCNSSYKFKNWTNAEGEVISTSRYVTVTMGKEDIHLIANCEYSPSIPANRRPPQPSAI